MKSLTVKYPIAIIILMTLLTRIPLLLSPYLLLDGDECVVGMMARTLYEGHNFSLFFWGQKYGFALIEIAAILPFYFILGYCTLAVKIGILSLWTFGTIFLYKTLVIICKNIDDAFLLIVVFICQPAWFVWSMKACAGYTTAFLLGNILLYMILCKKHLKKGWFYIVLGLITELIFESQRLWLAGIMPFVVYLLLQEKSVKKTALFIVSFCVLFLLFYWYKQTQIIEAYHVDIAWPNYSEFKIRTERFLEYLFNALHGDYYFSMFNNPNFFNAALAGVLTLGFFVVFVAGIYNLLFAKEKNWLFVTSALFVPLTFCYTLLTITKEGRYLLPVSGFMLIALGILLKGYVPPKAAKVATGILMLIGIGSCISFYSFNEISKEYKKSVLSTINYLKVNNIHYTYSTDCMLPYQVIFYSNEEIMCRMPFQPARYQPYSDVVDSAFDSGAKVAILQYQNEKQNMSFRFDKKTPDIAICINPPITEMWKGIEFHHIHAK